MDDATQLPYELSSPVEIADRMRSLQEQGAIHRATTLVGDPAWLVVRHEQVRQLLDDDRLGRSHREPEKAARADASLMMGGPPPGVEFDTEHEYHAQMRALMQPLFTPKFMRSLRPRVEQLTTQLLDSMEAHGPSVDLHTELSVPLPLHVICELLGVPYGDREQFRVWIKDVGNMRDKARSEAGMLALFEYGIKLVTEKRQNPDDDVITRLLAHDHLADHEIAMLSMSLLFAGHESTIVQIDMGTLLLLANPEQWQKLVNDPSLIPGAVEEVLRASYRGGGTIPRYARSDIEVETSTIKAGDLLLLDVGAANHDPTVFAEPNSIDITRPSSGHMTFGYGSHYCLGAPLARIELQLVFSQLVTRFPGMRLAVPLDELTIQRETLGGGVVSLPVQW